MRAMDMVVADNLVKTFPTTEGREKRAVDGLSFVVGEGRIYGDRKSTRLNSSHIQKSRMPSSA